MAWYSLQGTLNTDNMQPLLLILKLYVLFFPLGVNFKQPYFSYKHGICLSVYLFICFFLQTAFVNLLLHHFSYKHPNQKEQAECFNQFNYFSVLTT